ncbi:MAG: hypothetical protein M0037_02500 [Betaproteobacteria bacterium]|nr:hypothetical protein [Betaproteobacteria bacterium]
MTIERASDGSLILELASMDAATLAKRVIHDAQAARSTLLTFAYHLNEAWYDARNDFRLPAPTGTDS